MIKELLWLTVMNSLFIEYAPPPLIVALWQIMLSLVNDKWFLHSWGKEIRNDFQQLSLTLIHFEQNKNKDKIKLPAHKGNLFKNRILSFQNWKPILVYL